VTTTSPKSVSPPDVEPPAGLEVFLPDPDGDLRLDQDEEWCEAIVGGERMRIRFHDYHLIYDIPGMYEKIFYDLLECSSPRVVRSLLAGVLAEQGMAPGNLRVLDVGAGNGMVGEEIRALGAGTVVGTDILDEAAAAAARDRPGVYDDYVVADLTALTPAQHAALVAADLNTMTTVAALGFGDMPPAAFGAAFNMIGTPGLLVFTIKEDFVGVEDPSGFRRLIQRMFDEKVIVPLAEEHYRHRISVRGEPLYYIAYVARKMRHIPESWLS
jgi:Predicted methyltransferase (contains TPR repeat)